MFCMICGTENDDSSGFCAVCGAQLQSTAPGSGTAPAASAAPVKLAVDLDAIAQQIETSKGAYASLIDQFKELGRQQESGAITPEVYAVARQQLVMSHTDGEQAAQEADLILLHDRHERGEISDVAFTIKREELKDAIAKRENRPTRTKEQIVRDAQLAALEDKRKQGLITDEAYELRRQQVVIDNPIKHTEPNVNPADTGSAGYGVLGFFFPLVGLILYLVWKDEKPRSAKMAGNGALISVVITVVIYLIYFIVFASMVSSITRYY